MRRFWKRSALMMGVVTLACSSGDLTSPLQSVGTGNSSGNNATTPAAVIIAPPPSTELIVGTSLNLVAAVKSVTGADLTNVTVGWTSSDPNVATINTSGIVTALRPGVVQFTASVVGHTATLSLTVKGIPVASVIVSVNSPLVVGDSSTALAFARDAQNQNVVGPSVSWSSQDPSIATVSSTGIVKAVSPGLVLIDAIMDGVLGSSAMIVAPVQLQSTPAANSAANVAAIVVLLNNPNLGVNLTTVANAFLKDSVGNLLTGRAIVWSSSNPNVATVSQNGAVTSVGAGTASIYASSGGRTGSQTITVTAAALASINSISVQLANPTLGINLTTQATASVLDSAGNVLTGRPINWTSSDPSVATVSSTGLVTTVAAGTTKINAGGGNKNGGKDLKVTAAQPPSVASIAVQLANPSLGVNQTTQATATVLDSVGNVLTGRVVTWTTSNPATATVTQQGAVTSVAAGVSTISATTGGKTGSTTFTVTVAAPPAPPTPPSVNSITVQLANPSLAVNLTTQGIATLLDSAGNVLTGRTVSWASSNTAVATVSPSGLVTSIAVGGTTISAASGGKSAQATFTVTPSAPPSVGSVTLQLSNPSVRVGQTTLGTATVVDSAGNLLTGRVVTWTSSSAAVASVSSQGIVTANAVGSTTITATTGGQSGTATLTVTPTPPTSISTISVQLNNPSIALPGTTQATATVLDSASNVLTGRQITWTSSNPAIATVSQAGAIVTLAAGTSTITATSGSVSGAAALTVTPAVLPPSVASITVSLGSANIAVNLTTQATALVKDSVGNAMARVVTWTSSNTAVATISSTGSITAKGGGTTTITAATGGKTGTAALTVTGSAQVPATISVTPLTNSISAGTTALLTVIVKDASGVTMAAPPLTWSSSASSVATVTTGGLVTGVSPGSATITVGTGSLSASATFTITAATASTEVLAEYPRVFLNTAETPAPAAGGKVISVAAGGNLQTAINSAVPGDVIELANGATFVGTFTLPNKNTTSTNWITIRPANWSSLPAAGTRMTPTLAAQLNLPKVLSGTSNNTIVTALSAHHYRIMGIEIGVVPNLPQNWGLVAFDGGAGQTSLGVVPHDLILDRTYIHGNATVVLRRCILLNSANSAVIDSWVSDCHDNGSDSQAILGYNGPGPFKITNNYLEGAGENVMFGGADPAIPNLVPSDIEIRGNYFFKPLSWKMVWLVKNLLETKNAQRVLIEGNLLENSWTHGQNGLGIGIKTSNQSGGCTWCVSQDITLRLNLIRNVGAGINIAASPDNSFLDIHARRITVMDNVITNINVGAFDGDGRGIAVFGDAKDVVLAHNTMISATSAGLVFGPWGWKTQTFTARDNVLGMGVYGLIGDNLNGGPAFAYYAPGGTLKNNVMVLVNGSSGYPAGNFYASTLGNVQLTNVAAFDFHLASTSPYKGKASDGRDPGADIDAVNNALIGVP